MTFKVEGNYKANRLSYTAPAHVTKSNLDRFFTDLRFCISDMQPNFDVVGDFSNCNLMYLNSTGTLRYIMQYLLEKRIRDKIRVVSDNFLSRQLKTVTARQRVYEPIYVSTLHEAESHLATERRRNGLRIYLQGKTGQFFLNDEAIHGHIMCMSTSGCSMEQKNLQPLCGAKALLTLDLEEQKGVNQHFEIRTEVIRSEKGMIFIKFLDLEEAQKDTLWKCLLYESGFQP